MPAYLTAQEAKDRLTGGADPANEGYGYTTEQVAGITPGDVLAASQEVDYERGPWLGYPKATSQEGAFPRDRNPDGTENTSSAVPDAVLDATALLAYSVSKNEGPAVKSQGLIGASVTYTRPKLSPAQRRALALLRPYRLSSVQIRSASDYPHGIRVRNPLGPV